MVIGRLIPLADTAAHTCKASSVPAALRAARRPQTAAVPHNWDWRFAHPTGPPSLSLRRAGVPTASRTALPSDGGAWRQSAPSRTSGLTIAAGGAEVLDGRLEGVTVMRQVAAVAIVLVAAGTAARAQSAQVSEKDTRTLNLSAYAELLRSDVRAPEGRHPHRADGAHRKPKTRRSGRSTASTTLELAKLGDERVALIADYAHNYAKLTDASRRSARAPRRWISRRGGRP